MQIDIGTLSVATVIFIVSTEIWHSHIQNGSGIKFNDNDLGGTDEKKYRRVGD